MDGHRRGLGNPREAHCATALGSDALKGTETLKKAACEVARVLLARVGKGTGDAQSEVWSEGPEGAASL